jgi:hypothetical protein
MTLINARTLRFVADDSVVASPFSVAYEPLTVRITRSPCSLPGWSITRLEYQRAGKPGVAGEGAGDGVEGGQAVAAARHRQHDRPHTRWLVEVNIEGSVGAVPHADLLASRFLTFYRQTPIAAEAGLEAPPAAIPARSLSIRSSLRLVPGAFVVIPAFGVGGFPGGQPADHGRHLAVGLPVRHGTQHLPRVRPSRLGRLGNRRPAGYRGPRGGRRLFAREPGVMPASWDIESGIRPNLEVNDLAAAAAFLRDVLA